MPETLPCFFVKISAIKEFSEYVLDSWKLYCQIHDLGLIVFLDELIEKKDPYWKKFNWHKSVFLWAIRSAFLIRFCNYGANKFRFIEL